MIYETTDIKLGAVILCEIPDSHLIGVDADRCINSKKVLLLEYPEEYRENLNKLVGDYARKIQLINVYQYNKALSLMRDALRDSQNGDRLQAKGAGDVRR